MFNNVGSKIQKLAKFLFFLNCIGGIIGGAVLIIIWVANGCRYYEEFLLFIGIGLAAVLPIVSFVCSWILYGYGEIVEKAEKTE